VKNVYAAELAGVRRDLQNDKRWKYDELPPVQSLEKLKRDQYLAHNEIARASAAGSAGLHPRDRGLTPISLLQILHCFRTAYRLGGERYRQRRQLMEMDDRQLKDIGITREQAEQEARKPIWKS
jgi:uncharacterized protein YjiS (DUF1127 family)